MSEQESVAEALAGDLISYRLFVFERIGFDSLDALELAANKDVDWQQVHEAVKAGCSLALAKEIFT